MKNVLIDLLKKNGFTERPIEAELLKRCNGLMLQREWSKEIEVAWYGKRTESYSVRVFINRDSSICHVTYAKDGSAYKDRWYDTIGKRTYNAIVETARCAGYEI